MITIIKERYPQTVLATAWYSSVPPQPPNNWRPNNWQISDKPKPEKLLGDPWAIPWRHSNGCRNNGRRSEADLR